MQRIIGIDFGTSTTYMNIKRYNGAQPDGDKFSYIPVMFNYGESSGYVATIVRENADGSFDFGEKASEPLEGSKIHTEIKMRLESSDEQERAEARRITREFFKFLHDQYAQQAANLGGAGDQEETVVSYPVKWKKETAQFMLDAARDAGFRNVRGMDEAEAAVATVLCQNSGGTGLIYADKPGYLLLIDMGAGTTDLVVCRYQASTNGEIAIELVTSWPHSADEPTFGGREIDKVLEQYVEDHLTKSLLPALAPQASVIARAPGQAKMWKERNVSVTLAADKKVNTCAYIGTYKTMGMLTGDFPAFGRREFESFAESGLRDYARLISGCLEKTAEVDENFSALDLVILTGGHSAWYFAKEILTGAMEGWLDHPMLAAVREDPCRVVSLPNPQTTVSLGLVYSKLPFKLAKKENPKTTIKSVEVSPPVDACYKWDDRLLPALRKYVEENGHFSVMNNVFSRHAYLPPQLRKDLHLQDDEEVLFARIVRRCDENDNVERIDGWVYSSKGIYTADLNIPESNFCPWETFMRFEDDPDVDAARKLVFDPNDPFSDTNEEIFFNADLYDLRDFLREQAINLQKAAAPKRPVQMATQPSDKKYYKWDDRFLSIVKQFIQEDPVIRSRNQIHKYPDHKKLWYLVERRNTTDHEIYFVNGFGRGGQNKAIICSHGLDVSYYQGGFWGYSHGPEGGVVSWDEFLNGNLRDLNSFSGRVVQEMFGLGDSLCSLQALLREEVSKEPKQTSASLSLYPIVILPINDRALTYAQDIQSELELCCGIQAKIDNRNLSLGKRIREAEQKENSYILVVREEDEIPQVVSVRRFGTDLGAMELQQFEELYRAGMSQEPIEKQTERSTTELYSNRRVVILPARGLVPLANVIEARLSVDYAINARIDYRDVDSNILEGQADYILLVDKESYSNVVAVWRGSGEYLGRMSLDEFESVYRGKTPQMPEKQTNKQSTPQTLQTAENESLDAAMKRFNRQVKDAKRQQKASAKPAQPTQTATQASNRTYKWDDRLLPIVKEFIQKDATFCKTNDLYRTDVVAQMRISFGLPAVDEIYYALATDGFFTRRSAKGNTGIIIASSGLWELETLPLKKSNYHITWEMILNGVVHAATKDRMFETINYKNLSYACPRYAFGDTAVMSRLQKLLREKSVALEEGRPI